MHIGSVALMAGGTGQGREDSISTVAHIIRTTPGKIRTCPDKTGKIDT